MSRSRDFAGMRRERACPVTFFPTLRRNPTSPLKLAIVAFAIVAPLSAQTPQLRTADAVLERYKTALGGAPAIAKVQSMTVHGEAETSGVAGKATFVAYSKPFKSLFKLTRPDGTK